jgi:hypothetical protein
MVNKEPTLKDPSARWLWLFVVTYIIHVAEEYWGGEGYSAHLLKHRGVYMSPTRFLIVQAIGIALMVAGVLIAKRFRFSNALAVIFGAAVLVNALAHLVNSLRSMAYEPGLISGIIIWMPLGLFSIIYFRGRVLNQKRFWISIAIGLVINVAIILLTLRGGKL